MSFARDFMREMFREYLFLPKAPQAAEKSNTRSRSSAAISTLWLTEITAVRFFASRKQQLPINIKHAHRTNEGYIIAHTQTQRAPDQNTTTLSARGRCNHMNQTDDLHSPKYENNEKLFSILPVKLVMCHRPSSESSKSRNQCVK